MISARTKAALQAAKARGAKLGGDRGVIPTAAARARAKQAVQERAPARATDIAPTIAELQAAGVTSLRRIASALNEHGTPTPRGQGGWSVVQVARVMERS
jgi:DNA invertase Pin-like site-specific DNA recombinase